MSDNIPLFKKDSFYEKADRWEHPAHGQMFVLYEFSIGFIAHQLSREQLEDWLSTKGLFIANLDGSPKNTQRLRDLAWHIWYRGRPCHDASRPQRRISKQFTQPILRYRDLLTKDLESLFESSTFWLAERLDFDRDLGHIWKVLIAPLHIARTCAHLEQLIVGDVPSPWRSVPIPGPDMTATWIPDLPSRRRIEPSITN